MERKAQTTIRCYRQNTYLCPTNLEQTMKQLSYVLFLMLVLFTSCTSKQGNRNETAKGESIEIKYAEGFAINKCSDYMCVTVFNPWKKGEIYDRYYLVKKEETAVPQDGKKILIPLKTIVPNSATYLEFIKMLGEQNKIVGVPNTRWIYSPEILQKVKEGKIKELGDAFNLDIEKLMMIRPQAVMTPAYDAEDTNAEHLKRIGIPMIYNIEWQEKSLLGRAEWIKFVAAFFDKCDLAEKLYNDIEKKYNDASTISKQISKHPVILDGQDFRGTWSMPGGRSYNGKMFKDAGASYFYEKDTTTGSIPSSIEAALMNFNNAEVWIGTKANSLEELGKTDSKYRLFKAFKMGNVYNYNKRMSVTGGNDYWESGVAHPDLILKDVIKALHPELLPNYEFTYTQKLK